MAHVEAILATGIQALKGGWVHPLMDGVTLVVVPAILAFSVVVAARFAWLAVASRRLPGRQPLGDMASALLAPIRHQTRRDAAPAVPPSPAAPTTVAAGPAPRPAPPAPASRAEEVLRTVASRMDEVTYAPGSPNVLTMIKLVRHGPHPARAESVAAPAPAPHAAADPRMRVSRTDDGAATALRIEGALDAVTAADLRPRIEALLAGGRNLLTLDLSALELIDSVGVGVLVSLHKRCADGGGALRVTGLREQPLGIFRLLRLDRVLTLS